MNKLLALRDKLKKVPYYLWLFVLAVVAFLSINSKRKDDKREELLTKRGDAEMKLRTEREKLVAVTKERVDTINSKHDDIAAKIDEEKKDLEANTSTGASGVANEWNKYLSE